MAGICARLMCAEPALAVQEELAMSPEQYVQWGWLLITVPNLIVIGLMIVVFLLAAYLQLPSHTDDESRRDQ